MKPLIYVITGHGYGHGVRSCDILRAVRERAPELPIRVVTDLPHTFLKHRLGDPLHGITLEARALDVGMVQKDSIRVDLDATEHVLAELCRTWEAAVDRESRWLVEVDAGAVVSDIPAIPLAAAAACGIPAAAVGNFGWDFIYRGIDRPSPVWREAADRFAAGYAGVDRLLRLPFHEPMSAFPTILDSPLVSRPGTPQRDRLAALTGADPGATWALLSFSTLDWSGEALTRVRAVPGTEFFTVRPLAFPGLRAVDRRDCAYTDVLASCDVVITKPGYGVLSECAVNHKPLVYAERTDFAEYPVLEAAVKRYFRQVHLPAVDLYRGNLDPALAAVAKAPPPQEIVPSDEGAFAAESLLAMM